MTKRIDFKEETKQIEFVSKIRATIKDREHYAAVITFGCQQNEADSEKVAGLFELMGYTVLQDVSIGSEQLSYADLIIVNTCAIREHAELKALSNTGRLKKLKDENPDLLIGMCGCMVQEKHRTEQIKQSYHFVDFLLGTDSIYKLPEVVLSVLSNKKRIYSVSHLNHSELGIIEENIPTKRSSSYKTMVPIMYGCNNFCSYCVVPSVRGHERSRDEVDIIDEVTNLVASGCKEITLLGQNVNSYAGNDGGFTALLKKLLDIDGDFRLRFMTSHPKDASDELIELLAHPKMASHFHLPFQSGSNRILEKMRRGYTREKYLEIAHKIRQKLPQCSVTTDIIVGFPFETDEDFADTLDIVRQIEFDMIYAFLFSPRKNTAAATFDGQISDAIKAQRFAMLTELANNVSEKRNQLHIGQTQKILVETESQGRNSQNKLVKFENKGGFVNIGEFAFINITEAFRTSLFGKLQN